MATRTQVYRITTADVGLTSDQQSRTTKYLVSMAIRTMCLIGAVVATGWVRWVMVAGAIILPYFAVVIANGGREPRKDSDLSTSVYVQPQDQRALPSRAPDRAD